jgi:hypothetical protein
MRSPSWPNSVAHRPRPQARAGPPGAPSRPMRASCSKPRARAAFACTGTKAWCSGAASVTHAVVSGWNAAGEPCLAAVAMDQPGVRVTARAGTPSAWPRAPASTCASTAHAPCRSARPATTCAGPASGRAAPALPPAGSAARWALRAGCAKAPAPRPTPTGSRTSAPSRWRWAAPPRCCANPPRGSTAIRKTTPSASRCAHAWPWSRPPTRSCTTPAARWAPARCAATRFRAGHGRPARVPAPEPCRARPGGARQLLGKRRPQTTENKEATSPWTL